MPDNITEIQGLPVNTEGEIVARLGTGGRGVAGTLPKGFNPINAQGEMVVNLAGVDDESSIQDVLDSVKPIQSYTALRAYSGQATSVRITTPGIAGFFYRSTTDTTSADNGGTVIVDASGRRWLRLYAEPVNIKWFGAVGGGADDTVAIQAAFDYIKTNGGLLQDTVGGTYMVGALSLTGSLVEWEFRGNRNTKFKRINDVGGTVFASSSSVVPFTLSNFSLDCAHDVYANGNHGISIADMEGLRLRDIHVTNYKNSAILVFATVPNTYGDCLVENCTADGLAVANNGMLVAEMPNSGFVNCSVVGATGSPGYGLQLKNDCRSGFITNGYAENCVAGLAFGQDSAASAVKRSTVLGMRIKGCLSGVVLGYAENNTLTGIQIDQETAGLEAINLSGTSFGNYIEATVSNAASGKSVARFRTGATDNAILISELYNPPATPIAALFDSGSLRNDVVLARMVEPTSVSGGPSALVTDNSLGQTNTFEYTPYPTYMDLTIAAGGITVANSKATSIIVRTEASAATDDLDTITTNALEGALLTLRSFSNTRDVVVKNNTGNILLNGGADCTLGAAAATLTLRYNSGVSKWCEVSRGTGA